MEHIEGTKRPFITREQVDEIVKTCPTPFHIYDEKGIRENARRLMDAFAWNPGYREFFAVKATPSPVILKMLCDMGCGLDCSSLTELMLADAIGVGGERVMFSSNDTPAEEFVYARAHDDIVNLDDITHIDFLARNGGIPKLISCRFNPGRFAISNAIMDAPSNAKYGFTRDQIRFGFKRLKDLGAEKFGLHAFLSSNTSTESYYPALARVLFELAAELADRYGYDIDFVNLSGGIGVPYYPDQKPNDIARIGDGVRKVFEEVMVPAGLGHVKIYTELGRYMLAPYGALVATAIHSKHTYKEYIGLDACACDLMRPAMYGAYHHVTVLGKEDELCDHVYDITGSLCENNDKFAVDRSLPRIDIGDYIYIHDTGAHGHSMGYNYNGKLRHAELLLREDGSVQMIRRAETPKDYFATLDFLGLFDWDGKK
ncbi:MAG: diaminopimelate decarboxylase [Oscillospiraceae bacterium]|nr:diaminopimelate decarboxylase [Oscillospiraceae bacterium]